jgi:hypothetical protein
MASDCTINVLTSSDSSVIAEPFLDFVKAGAKQSLAALPHPFNGLFEPNY